MLTAKTSSSSKRHVLRDDLPHRSHCDYIAKVSRCDDVEPDYTWCCGRLRALAVDAHESGSARELPVVAVQAGQVGRRL